MGQFSWIVGVFLFLFRGDVISLMRRFFSFRRKTRSFIIFFRWECIFVGESYLRIPSKWATMNSNNSTVLAVSLLWNDHQHTKHVHSFPSTYFNSYKFLLKKISWNMNNFLKSFSYAFIIELHIYPALWSLKTLLACDQFLY